MRNKVLILVAAAAVVLGIAFALMKRQSAAPPDGPATSSDPVASQFPLCRDVEAAFKRMASALNCPGDDRATARAICEVPYTKKPACLDELEAATACMKAEPAASWRCGQDGVVELKETTCPAQVKALGACLNE